jgi:hypothetical protein
MVKPLDPGIPQGSPVVLVLNGAAAKPIIAPLDRRARGSALA